MQSYLIKMTLPLPLVQGMCILLMNPAWGYTRIRYRSLAVYQQARYASRIGYRDGYRSSFNKGVVSQQWIRGHILAL